MHSSQMGLPQTRQVSVAGFIGCRGQKGTDTAATAGAAAGAADAGIATRMGCEIGIGAGAMVIGMAAAPNCWRMTSLAKSGAAAIPITIAPAPRTAGE